MKTENQFCGNPLCKTTNTPLWRKGWTDPSGKSITLCNSCGLLYRKGHFCQGCLQIYRESDQDNPENPWIGCDRCSRWVHKNCDSKISTLKEGESYICLTCQEGSLTEPNKKEKEVKKRKKSTGGQKKKKKSEEWVSIDQLELPLLEQEKVEVLDINREELEQNFKKNFADRDGSLLKLGSLCVIAELEMKMFETPCEINF